MTYQKQANFKFDGFTSIIVMVLFFVALYFVAQFVFTILWYASPFLLGAALLFDSKGVLGFGKWLISLVKRNVLVGLGAILLCAIGFPVVSLFLFGKAMFKKKLKDVQKQYEDQKAGEFVEYEELKESEEILELPPIKEKAKPKSKPAGNEYDTFFEQ